MPYQFKQLTPSVTLCSHHGPVTLQDSRQLQETLRHLDGKLLVDLTDTPTAEISREFLRVRSMLPQTAFFGGALSPILFMNLPGSHYYMHEARQFETEVEALAWLNGEEAAYFMIDPALLAARRAS